MVTTEPLKGKEVLDVYSITMEAIAAEEEVRPRSLANSKVIVIGDSPWKAPQGIGEEGSTEEMTTILVETKRGRTIKLELEPKIDDEVRGLTELTLGDFHQGIWKDLADLKEGLHRIDGHL
ncbi:hypothetical protein ACLOJK_023845 [Asimina triloba]